MRVPSFVRRAAVRALAGGLLSAIAVGTMGAIWLWVRYGTEPSAVRQRIAADVRQQFADISGRLDIAVANVNTDPALIASATRRDPSGLRELFERVATAEIAANLPGIAVTVYGADQRPIAWAGRPATIPPARLTGPDALFLAQSPLGLRLVRVGPLGDPLVADRRIATIVAEAPLPRASQQQQPGEAFFFPTGVAPVPLRPRFEGAPDASTDAILITGPRGEALASVDVPENEVAATQERRRTRLLGLLAGILCAVTLLLAGPLLDWRRLVTSVGTHLTLTAGVLLLLITARAIAWNAVRLGQLDQPALAPRAMAGVFWLALASPADFLLTTLLIGAVVALAASSFEQWRQSRRRRRRVVPGDSVVRVLIFVIVQLIAGASVAVLIGAYQVFLQTRLTQAPVDILRFALTPWEPARLTLIIGLVVLHAALIALAILILRVASSPWVIAASYRWLRALMLLLWIVPTLFVFTNAASPFGALPIAPAALVVAVVVVGAWRLRRYRAMLEHTSQAARLAMFFVALAIPSVVFYPSLVDAAGRARQQVVETHYAPEVTNHRLTLQLRLEETLAQIDALEGLDDLVTAGTPVVSGPAPTDAAFHVWSRTALNAERLTSSIELYDAAGALVSRFALKLPEAAGTQISQEGACRWEVFGEASPFFAEQRILLHAGRAICVEGPRGRQLMVGSIVVHVMLDYSNLSFISAQSPYVALLRAGGGAPDTAPRADIEFNMYGWSRRPLYMSGRDAWPLTEPVFGRVFESRNPFWAEVTRGDDEYDVYFLNDRGAIYALGYRRTSAFGHLISLAELTVLAAVTYLLLLVASAIYGLVAARTPTSGRALLREVRATFYRKLFIAFVAAAVIPVLTLAFVSRAYIADLMLADLEMEAARTAASASRVVEDVGTLEARGGATLQVVDDNLVVWLSRVIAQDVNIFDSGGLLASSERNLFVTGHLPDRTSGEVYRAIMLEGRPSHVARESVGGYEYLVAAAPVRVQNREAILTVPLNLREQEILGQIDELDRRVVLAAVLFIMLGAGIGYSMAERIADPVNRLMKATGRIARGDLDARILATSSDEFRRLVEAFNRMAADLQRQRAELERTNRLAAWADMARQVAHDIKNPLTPIQLNAEHLRRVHTDRGDPMGPVLDECVNNILTQVKLLRQIAGEFSSFASSPTARPAPTSLHNLVTDVVEPYRIGLAGRVTINADVPDSLPMVLVDKTLLARALTNIIENALHAMPRGGVLTVNGRHASDREVELAIADTGIGMDREALDRIFEPYFSTRAAGTGLGLTIAKRNVELNNGRIDVSSVRGEGTTVTLTLPAVATELHA